MVERNKLVNDIVDLNDSIYKRMSNEYFQYQQLKFDFERLTKQIQILRNVQLKETDYKDIEIYKEDLIKLEKSLLLLQIKHTNLFAYLIEEFKECNNYIGEIINGEKKLILK